MRRNSHILTSNNSTESRDTFDFELRPRLAKSPRQTKTNDQMGARSMRRARVQRDDTLGGEEGDAAAMRFGAVRVGGCSSRTAAA